MTRFVLDASAAVSWCFENEKTRWGEAALECLNQGGEALAPPLWTYEILNALTMAQRRGRASPAQVLALISEFRKFPITIAEIPDDLAVAEILTLASKFKLSAYDAAYLELAMREGLPLATLDGDLKKAAKLAGVSPAFE